MDKKPPFKYWKPILTVLLVTPFLTELLSNNLPPSSFFLPHVYLSLATIAYGIPVLLLREFAVRRQMGIPALICLGLAYGIYNEGIIAKTFYLVQNVPVDTFDHYGFLGGIDIPWAVTISIWHSTHSLLYPLLLTYWLFPDHREQPWLGRKCILGLAIPTILLATLIFFTRSNDRGPGYWPHFVLMLALMASLLWIAARISAIARLTDASTFRVLPAIWGGLLYLALLLVPIIFSKVSLPTPLFYGYFIVIAALVFRRLTRHPMIPVATALLFAAGDQTVVATFGIIGAISRASAQELVTDIAFFVLFIALIFKVRSRAKHSVPAAVSTPGH